MADKACHVFGSTTHVGLTQALGLMRKLIATAALTFSCLCSASPVTSLKADPAIYRVTLAHIEAEFCKAPPLTAEDKASLVSAATAVTVPGLVFDHVITPMDYRSEEHTSELQSLMRISYAVFCLKKKKQKTTCTM